MKIFITGANGSVGTELIKQLLNPNSKNQLRPEDIIALALDENDQANLKCFPKINILFGDITAMPDSVLSVLSGIDVFIHLAALVHKPKAAKSQYYKVNYEATKKLYDAFIEQSRSWLKQFVFVSTVAVYGNYQSTEYSEVSKCLPDTPYGESKLLAENYIRDKLSFSSINYTIIRPATIYGGLNDKGNVARLIGLLKKWHFFPLFNSGKALKSFVFIGDVAQAIISCVNNKKTFGNTYNISAPALTMKEVIKSIAVEKGIKVIPLCVPMILLQMIRPNSILCHNNSYDFQKARHDFCYTPHIFPYGL